MNNRLWAFAAALIAASPRLIALLERWALLHPYNDIYNHGRLYMKRWWLLPRWCLRYDDKAGALMPARWMPFSVRLHHIVLPDPDRHLHDHPFAFRSIVLRGSYVEQDVSGASRVVGPGSTYASPPERFHRIASVRKGGALSLFIIGRRQQDWGFLVGDGRVPWRVYLDAAANDVRRG